MSVVKVVCCQVESLRWADLSSREFLPNVPVKIYVVSMF